MTERLDMATLEWIKENSSFSLMLLVVITLALRYVVEGFRKDDD